MDYKELYKEMYELRDEERAIKMSAYMRNLFPFLGVPSPKRKEICKKYFKAWKNEENINWSLVDNCFNNEYREFQYIAIEYLGLMKKHLKPYDVSKLKELIITKSWWDTIDGLDKIVGSIALNYEEVNETLLSYSVDDNFWLRRIAIDHQLLRKNKTNTELLETIIKNNFGQTEFFINKAIGWSLRDYSKTNPDWVRDFIERYKDDLAPLSIKEGSKYI